MQNEEPIEGYESPVDLQDSDLGAIQINNEVVATIVAIATKEVPGVISLAGGGFRKDFAGLFGGKRDTGAGVSIGDDEQNRYVIAVKVILRFGTQLAKVAHDIQIAVRDQVENMTNKEVARVDVVVDGVRHPESEADEFSAE